MVLTKLYCGRGVDRDNEMQEHRRYRIALTFVRDRKPLNIIALYSGNRNRPIPIESNIVRIYSVVQVSIVPICILAFYVWRNNLRSFVPRPGKRISVRVAKLIFDLIKGAVVVI